MEQQKIVTANRLRDGEAQKAIQELNGSSLDGREIIVNEAKPKKAPRDNRGGGNRW